MVSGERDRISFIFSIRKLTCRHFRTISLTEHIYSSFRQILLEKFATHLNDLCTFDAYGEFAFWHPGANFVMCMFSNDQICTKICTIANLLPSRQLHFGTGLQMYCKSDFSSCDCCCVFI